MKSNKTTSIRILEKTNQELSKLLKTWSAKSKVDALERIVMYIQKMNINPYDTIPEPMAAKVLGRVDMIIRFIRTNEKKQLENMERVITIAQDKLGNNNSRDGKSVNDELTDLLTSRLSILGDKEAVKSELIKASKKYTDYLLNNPEAVKSPDQAFQQFVQAINKIVS